MCDRPAHSDEVAGKVIEITPAMILRARSYLHSKALHVECRDIIDECLIASLLGYSVNGRAEKLERDLASLSEAYL